MARKELDGQDGKSESGEVGNEKEGRDDQPKSNETDDWTKTVEAANLVGEATISPVQEGVGLQRQPDRGSVVSVTATPSKASHQMNFSASPVFKNPPKKNKIL